MAAATAISVILLELLKLVIATSSWSNMDMRSAVSGVSAERRVLGQASI
jgi:hypothetical protein